MFIEMTNFRQELLSLIVEGSSLMRHLLVRDRMKYVMKIKSWYQERHMEFTGSRITLGQLVNSIRSVSAVF